MLMLVPLVNHVGKEIATVCGDSEDESCANGQTRQLQSGTKSAAKSYSVKYPLSDLTLFQIPLLLTLRYGSILRTTFGRSDLNGLRILVGQVVVHSLETALVSKGRYSTVQLNPEALVQALALPNPGPLPSLCALSL